MAVDGVSEQSRDVLRMWTIYYSHRDYPGLFVVRGFDIVRGHGEPVPHPSVRTATSLELARELVPHGLYRLERSADDDPSVVETWL
jgi:hypothetical protein